MSALRDRGLVLAAILCLCLPLLPFIPDYWITLADYIGLSSLVAMGLVLLTGVGGMTSFGQAAFVGFGAYSTAVLSSAYGISPWICLPVGLLITGSAAWAIGVVTVRLSGHYLPLGTIAWGISFYYLFGNLQLLGAHDGIAGIAPLTVASRQLTDEHSYYYVVWLIVIGAIVATENLLDCRIGRSIRALRTGAVAAESFGINTARTKLVVFVYAALLADIAGWLFAHMQRAINPSAFGVNASIEYLFMAVLGGAGKVFGAILGAGITTLLKDRLQDVLPKLLGAQGNFETIVFGLLLIFFLQTARDGLWPLVMRLLPEKRPPAPDLTALPLPKRQMPAAGSALLQVSGISKQFGGLTAVNEVSFEVAAGQIVGLIGPNGAGKSTTFNLLTGLLPLSRGEVRLCDRRIDGSSARTIAGLGVARTFQHVKLVAEMSVLDNVALGAHQRGQAGVLSGVFRLDRDQERRIFRDAAIQLERVGLAEQMHLPAGSLALGQQRLVEIARALCLDPLLLLLDEPAAGLRYLEKTALAQLLQRLRRDGMSILLVEHDMDFVMGITDQLVVLDFGTVIARGIPTAVQADPAVLEAYLGGVA